MSSDCYNIMDELIYVKNNWAGMDAILTLLQ